MTWAITVTDRDGNLVDAVTAQHLTVGLRAVIAWMGGRRRNTFKVRISGGN